MLWKFNKTVGIFTCKSDNRHRPFYNSTFHIFVTWYGKLFFYISFVKCKVISATLEMFVSKNWTTHNRQIGIWTDNVMWEHFDKVKQLSKCWWVNNHRRMFTVKNNTMFIVIYIWWILHIPLTVIKCYRNNSVVTSCRMINSTGITLIFFT